MPHEAPDWAGQPVWRVLDTDWALGQRFLATWQAWRQDPQRPSLLHYVAFTEVPTDTEQLTADAQTGSDAPALLEALRAQWRGLLPGFHRLVLEGGQVQLTLCVAELRSALREQAFQADTVYLGPLPGGPTEERRHLFKALSLCCRRGTRLSAAIQDAASRAELEAGLAQRGFLLPPSEQASDPAHLEGEFQPRWQLRRPAATAPALASPGRCVVIGGGLSGASVAYSLALRGWQVEVLDRAAEPAAGASGLPAGLVAPHVSPDDRALSRLSRCGVRATLQRARQLLREGLDWAPSGVLEHRVEGKRALPEAWAQAAAQGRPHPGLEWSAPAPAARLREARLPETASALWHAQAGWIRPAQLVRAMLAQPGIRWRGNQAVARLRRDGTEWQLLDDQGRLLAAASLVVVAAGYDTRDLLSGPADAQPLPLNPLRGQIAWGPMPERPAARQVLPPFPVNGHGSLVAGVAGPQGLAWFTGSTFERSNPVAEVRAEDQQANLERLGVLLPEAAKALAPAFAAGQVQAWAGVRCTLPDRLPAVGPIDPEALPGLWACTAMGARGLTLAVLCGELTAAWLHGEPLPLEQSLARGLLARRWHRAQRPAD
ncbi:FAD-dependent 5-carboxymethylaminomethyl-2-thiouridine(34) oxidoreductase MnmC [Ramlibacter sp. 2FC]|uniref:FAD-dependent 5-carboxymethylaminomethyl-2-thiouridine(34) oxidoreductase MnmC n=1 Tax=Ramlibacter sp. 2FC TaxID=2502188 RepID=UPI0010F899AD|nr:FAD-dependent 5-carboxymethylaminomethyl-2-thiouridine(34) oxidoreductase MnmC [Ramlibacter sp. 2FC]